MIGLSGRSGGPGLRLADDPARLELLPADAVRAEAAAAGLAAHMAKPEAKGVRLLIHARALREHGRRAGAPESLAKAARVAEAALDHARTPAALAAARLERVFVTLDAAELAGDGALLDAARARFADLAESAPSDPVLGARIQGARARLQARMALDVGSAAPARDAEAAAAAAAALSRAADRRPELAAEAMETRLARADLLTGLALRGRDAALAARAAGDMEAQRAEIDGDRAPLLAARTATRLGAALTVQGELTGDEALLTRAAEGLACAFRELPPGHSPADRAALGRALGHAARALAEASDDASLYEAAERAFAAALAETAGWGSAPLPAILAYERAMLLARRGEGRGGRAARPAAETALKAQLIRLDGGRHPAAWAAAQVALARLYAPDRRPEAMLALTVALEVFREHGLKSLAESAAADLAALTAQVA